MVVLHALLNMHLQHYQNTLSNTARPERTVETNNASLATCKEIKLHYSTRSCVMVAISSARGVSRRFLQHYYI